MPTPKTGKSYTEVCGAALKKGGTCTQKAGHRTTHPGEGRCWLHGGNAGRPIEHGKYSRYAVIKSTASAALREHFEADPDPLNLLPDVLELRVLIADYRNRYDRITEALLAWHSSYTIGFQKSLDQWHMLYQDWAAKFVEVAESHAQLSESRISTARDLEPPPPPPAFEDLPSKPRQIIDILQVGQFIAQVGTLVEKIHKRQGERGLTLVELDQLLREHGTALVAVLSEEIQDDEQRRAILSKVSDRWDTIPIAIDRNQRAN